MLPSRIVKQQLTSLLPCQDDLVAFALPLDKLGVLSPILFLPFDALEFLLLDLAGLLHRSWEMSMPLDSAELRHMVVPSYKRIVVLLGLALPR